MGRESDPLRDPSPDELEELRKLLTPALKELVNRLGADKVARGMAILCDRKPGRPEVDRAAAVAVRRGFEKRGMTAASAAALVKGVSSRTPADLNGDLCKRNRPIREALEAGFSVAHMRGSSEHPETKDIITKIVEAGSDEEATQIAFQALIGSE